MNIPRINLSFFYSAVLMLIILSPALAAPTYSLSDLSGRPDRWPIFVTVKADLKYDNGGHLKKGQKARIVDVDGSGAVVLSDNGGCLRIPQSDCNLIEAANALSAADRKVDISTIQSDRSLWPERVTLLTEYNYQNYTVPPNAQYDLVNVIGNNVILYSRKYSGLFTVELNKTDFIEQARALALLPPDQRPSRIADALQGNLVSSDGSTYTKSLATAKIIALYSSASWCGPCRAFSPKLVEYFNSVKTQNPNLVIVLISSDQDAAKMLKYMKDENMPWPALPLASRSLAGCVTAYGGKFIPSLEVLDRFGNILASTFQGDQYIGPEVPLKSLDTLLAEAKAK